MLIKTFGAAVQGIDAILVTVETVVERGIAFTMVGMPDTAVKESYARVVSAMQQSGLEFPRRRIVINLSPADVRKEGAAIPCAASHHLARGARGRRNQSRAGRNFPGP